MPLAGSSTPEVRSPSDIRMRGMRDAGSVGVELQGWLQARKAGHYEIGTDTSIIKLIRMNLWSYDHSAFREHSPTLTTG